MKIVLSSCPPAHVQRIASALVEEKLAACVHASPIRSFYQWKGAPQEDEEVSLLIKAPAASLERLRERFCELHPYELPAFVVLQVDAEASLPAFVAWVQAGGG